MKMIRTPRGQDPRSSGSRRNEIRLRGSTENDAPTLSNSVNPL